MVWLAQGADDDEPGMARAPRSLGPPRIRHALTHALLAELDCLQTDQGEKLYARRETRRRPRGPLEFVRARRAAGRSGTAAGRHPGRREHQRCSVASHVLRNLLRTRARAGRRGTQSPSPTDPDRALGCDRGPNGVTMTDVACSATASSKRTTMAKKPLAPSTRRMLRRCAVFLAALRARLRPVELSGGHPAPDGGGAHARGRRHRAAQLHQRSQVALQPRLRDLRFEDLNDEDRKELVKPLVLRLMFAGTLLGWQISNGIDPKTAPPCLRISRLEVELANLRQALFAHPEWKDWVEKDRNRLREAQLRRPAGKR